MEVDKTVASCLLGEMSDLSVLCISIRHDTFAANLIMSQWEPHSLLWQVFPNSTDHLARFSRFCGILQLAVHVK